MACRNGACSQEAAVHHLRDNAVWQYASPAIDPGRLQEDSLEVQHDEFFQEILKGATSAEEAAIWKSYGAWPGLDLRQKRQRLTEMAKCLASRARLAEARDVEAMMALGK